MQHFYINFLGRMCENHKRSSPRALRRLVQHIRYGNVSNHKEITARGPLNTFTSIFSLQRCNKLWEHPSLAPMEDVNNHFLMERMKYEGTLTKHPQKTCATFSFMETHQIVENSWPWTLGRFLQYFRYGDVVGPTEIITTRSPWALLHKFPDGSVYHQRKIRTREAHDTVRNI